MNAANFQNLIIDSLGNADPSALSALQLNVPRYWQLYARVPYLELRYWYVRREAVRLLMACLNRQIDYVRRQRQSSRQSVESSREDSTLTGSSHEEATSEADRASESAFDSETNSSGSGSEHAARNSSQSSSGSASLSDSGHGAQSSEQTSSLNASSSLSSAASDSSDWNANDSQNRDAVRAFSNVMSQIGAIVVGNGGTITDRAGSDSSNAAGHSEDHRDTAFTAQHSDVRLAQSEQVAASHATSEFSAALSSSENASASAQMAGSGSSSAQNDLTGAGAGHMTASGAGESHLTAESARTTHADGEAHRTTSAQDQINSLMERLHQRFLHLQQLWKQANEMIEWFEGQRLAVAPYVLKQITAQYPEGVDADVANAYLVKVPVR